MRQAMAEVRSPNSAERLGAERVPPRPSREAMMKGACSQPTLRSLQQGQALHFRM